MIPPLQIEQRTRIAICSDRNSVLWRFHPRRKTFNKINETVKLRRFFAIRMSRVQLESIDQFNLNWRKVFPSNQI